MFKKLKIIFKNNSKVIENYSFMTLLPILSVAIGFFTYPFVIRALGTESYGTYIFIFSTLSLFTCFISFSFSLLATKEIAQNHDNKAKKSEIVSSIFFARLFLVGIALIIFIILPFIFPFVEKYFLLYFVCFLGIIWQIFSCNWYFQGMENMKTITYIQIFFSLLSLPFIFLYIKSPSDLLLYVIIITWMGLFWNIFAFFYMIFKDKIKIYWVGFSLIKQRYKITLPFFYKDIIWIVKMQSITQIIGIYFGMHEVALYDLAQKIVQIPLLFTWNINNALFPKFAKNPDKKAIMKVMKYEYILGILCIAMIILFWKLAVYILGWETMSESYYLTIILSINILTYLIIWVYMYFIFILNNKNKLILYNQIVAFVSFFVIMGIWLCFYQSIYVLVISLILSGIVEVLFCHYHFVKMKKNFKM